MRQRDFSGGKCFQLSENSRPAPLMSDLLVNWYGSALEVACVKFPYTKIASASTRLFGFFSWKLKLVSLHARGTQSRTPGGDGVSHSGVAGSFRESRSSKRQVSNLHAGNGDLCRVFGLERGSLSIALKPETVR